jgi:hypothetical protein
VAFERHIFTPENLTANAQPGGNIQLSWQAVDGTAGYQLYRQTPDETELTPYQRIDDAEIFLDTSVKPLFSLLLIDVQNHWGSYIPEMNEAAYHYKTW